MIRKIYQPTEKQEQNWTTLQSHEMPGDDEFKAGWMKRHHGKLAGWGIGKRDFIISNLRNCREYQMGLWQARVDFLQGLDYQAKLAEGENVNAYNCGYYRGWHDGRPLAGIDSVTVERLQNQYGTR